MFKRWSLACTSLAALLLAGCGERETQAVAATAAPANAAATTPAERLQNARNGNWLTLSGRVALVEPAAFQLDYGSGRVMVEMDDWDWFQEGRSLKVGDRVTVSGRVDRDLLEAKKIEASTVYVQNLGTHFFANSGDEEDFRVTTVYVPDQAAMPAAEGIVTGIEGREFVIGAPDGALRVDTAGMPDNPLDTAGAMQVKIGDRVQVWGPLDLDAHERPEIAAKGLVLLTPDKAKAS